METYQFGHADFELSVGLNRYSLKTIGVWPEENVDEILDDVRVALVSMTLLFGTIIPQLYALTMVIDELPLVIDNVLPSIAHVICLTKLVLLWRNKKCLSAVLASIKFDCFKWKEDWEREIMLIEAKRGRSFTMGGYLMVLSCAIAITLGPYFGLSYRIVNNITDIGDRHLPAQSYYPYEYWESPYYEITYFMQILSTIFASISFTSPVSFFSVIVYHNCAQLMILGLKIRNLISYREGSAYVTDKYANFSRKLKDIVDSHTHTIKTVNRIECSFQNLILANITGLTIMTGCLGFQISNIIKSDSEKPQISQLILLGSTLTNVLVHTFVYCFVGESLSSCCDEMYKKIYEANWYSWHPKDALSLMLIMIRTKKPMHLTAGKYIYLNLQSFSQILKTSAGYISMLIAVENK